MQIPQTQQKKSFRTLNVLDKDKFKRTNFIGTVVIKLTHDLKFEGSNQATAATLENNG